MKSTSTVRLNIQAIAKRLGIGTGKQLALATGFANGTAYGLFNETLRRIDLSTLGQLCDVLQCTPADILIYDKPKKERKHGTP